MLRFGVVVLNDLVFKVWLVWFFVVSYVYVSLRLLGCLILCFVRKVWCI